MALRGIHVPLATHSMVARHTASKIGRSVGRGTRRKRRKASRGAVRMVKRRATRKLKRLVKGSRAAKAYMAKIRRKRRR